jgi:hypothetical protein
VTTEVADAVIAIVGGLGVLTILFAAVNLSKEKFGIALAGLFFPPLGWVGAFRLARPYSPWARLYGKEKLARARARYDGAGAVHSSDR